jgi:hypothetical protein
MTAEQRFLLCYDRCLLSNRNGFVAKTATQPQLEQLICNSRET